MHELRRRFAINGADDEVTAVDIERRRVFVGLPEREGRLLGELLRGGDIGYELSLDPITPDRRRGLPDAPGDARLTVEPANSRRLETPVPRCTERHIAGVRDLDPVVSSLRRSPTGLSFILTRT